MIDNALLQQLAELTGAELIGASPLNTPLTIDFYQDWLNKSYQGEMSYLEKHFAQKKNPKLLFEPARSAIVFGFNYDPHPKPNKQMEQVQNLRVAKYAKGEDYHDWLFDRLKNAEGFLMERFADAQCAVFTDSKPVLERDLGWQAGLGWMGKNTCLISRKQGSFFLIGEIYTNLKIDIEVTVSPDFCGKCNRCIEACPTQALIAPHTLDARRCISYLNIESKNVPPLELREKMGDWFFGCDICQSVCPWNIKLAKGVETQSSSINDIIRQLEIILNASHKQLEKMFFGTPLLRARGFGLKRNAIIVATNLGLKELMPAIADLHDNEKLRELVDWSLGKFKEKVEAENN